MTGAPYAVNAALRPRGKMMARYLIAVVAVAIALLVRLVVSPSLFERATYMPFFFAVAATAAFGGMRPGLVATVLSVVLAVFLLPPADSFRIDSGNDRLQLLLFTVMAGCISLLSGAVYNAQRRAAAYTADDRERQARYRAVVESSGGILYDWDISTRRVVFGGSTQSLLGRTLAEMPSDLEEYAVLIHADDRERFTAAVGHIQQTGQRFSLEYRLERADGEYATIQDDGMVIRTGDGHSARLIGLLKDVTRQREQEKLQVEREAHIRSVVNNVVEAILVIDDRGMIDSFNPAAERVFGYKVKEVVGQNVKLLMPEPFKGEHDDYIANYLRTGQAKVIGKDREVVGRQKDGGTFLMELRVSEFTLRGRRYFTGIVRDVTARREAEERLRQSRERLAATQLHAPVGIVETNLSGQYVSVNDEFCHITRYSRDELLNLKISDVTYPDDWAQTHVLFERLAAGEVPSFRVEKRYVRKDGSILWADVYRTLLRDAEGKPQYVIGAILDISERKRAEEQLRAAEARFRTMANAAPVLIWQSDEGGVTFVNSHYLTFFGVPAEAAVGMAWAEFLHPDDHAALVGAYRSAFDRRARYEFQGRVRRHDGEYRWLHNVGMPHFEGPERAFVGFIGCSFDVTDIKRAEEALVEADRQKDDFLALLAHELRNPMAPIRNGLQLMRLAPANEEIAGQALTVMERQLSQLVRLVDDLMDVSRITRGKVKLIKEPIELAAVVNSAVESSRPLIDQMGHELTVTLPKEPVVVNGDLTRLAQVILNLLNNAAKYTDRGGHIWLTVERQGSDVVVSVADNGIGIPADQLPRIFDMFMQVDRSLVKAQGGLGIGLALVKGLVEMHGGSIEAKSEGRGRGSEFVVRLPVDVEASSPPPVEEAVAAPHSTFRILIVDDNRDAADSLGMMLKIMGNDTRTAYDGQEGVEQAEQYRPQVALFDLGLPKLNGHEACRRIREQAWGRNMMLIAITGWGGDEDRRRSHDAGFDHHMVKPVDPQVLMKLLAEVHTSTTNLNRRGFSGEFAT